ncbi:MAG TPA: zinc-binding alcohol dehydrogenase family protein [Planctomycetota bacterium]|nr:zinc-binding alcohol dehydrogenase family protein [Planctomycetota bacterium]
MKAAVVESFDHAPRYGEFHEPVAQAGDVIVYVHASAVSQLVRAQAAGKHYTSGKPPFVPGVDGVGRLSNGQRVYFAFPRPPNGAMAERVAVSTANILPLPDDVDDVTAAAIANPGMSSWAALTERTMLRRGESVLINGASGASGRLAIQIAKYLGAARVVATARNPGSEADLLALGADVFVPLSLPPAALTDRFRHEFTLGVDVVLDYLWGASAESLLSAVTGHGTGNAARRVRFVNIGSMGGAVIPLEAASLRSSGLELCGSGLGSLSNAALIRAIGGVMQAVRSAKLRIAVEAVPLSSVKQVWATRTAARIVLQV